MAIVVIEDEQRIASFLIDGLQAHGLVVLTAADGEAGLHLASGEGVDLVVLDLKLPKLSGEEVLRRLRARRPGLPVIVLTAKDAVADRVANLDAGAEMIGVNARDLDTLALDAPRAAQVLAAIPPSVVRVHLGRDQEAAVVLRTGTVSLDVRTRVATVDGVGIDLTAREFSLLETFMRHPGQVLSQAQLLDRVWGYDFDPGSNVVEVCARRLRKKLGAAVIETVRGAGYRFRP